MKKFNLVILILFVILSVTSCDKQKKSSSVGSKENLIYLKSNSSYCNFIFEDDKWISEELITIENSTDKKIFFEIYGFFDKDYKKNNIGSTNVLQGYADKNKEKRFFEIESNETKEFRIFFISKSTGKNQKANSRVVERVYFTECKNSIKMIKTDYEIIKNEDYKKLELKILNEQILDMFNEFIDPWVVLYVPEKLFARGQPFIDSSDYSDCDYTFPLTEDRKALLVNNTIILTELK